jgi:hypothetical protein
MHMPKSTASIECPHCDMPHIVERGEDGEPDDLDLVSCVVFGCNEELCRNCRMMCDFCGKWACEEHITSDEISICDICMEDEDSGYDQ